MVHPILLTENAESEAYHSKELVLDEVVDEASHRGLDRACDGLARTSSVRGFLQRRTGQSAASAARSSTTRTITAPTAGSIRRSSACNATFTFIFRRGTTRTAAYPLVIFFHMANADEHYFVHSTMLKVLDALIASGAVPAGRRRVTRRALGHGGPVPSHSIRCSSTGRTGDSRTTSSRKSLPFLMANVLDPPRA